MFDCDTCGWHGPEYALHQFDDHNSSSYCCPMCGSSEVYATDEDTDDET